MVLDEHPHMMDWWFNLFGPYSWIIMTFGFVVLLSISILIAYYVHKDAVRRGIANSEVWLLIVLIFNVIGLLIYLLVRGNYAPNYEEQNMTRNTPSR
ncbi:MAG: hypothetical protein JW776_05450 [Candidatus Lokiarchaeota archaeon]|nr:hypothetical protein [Candidatus Lokiarchaeota archaeon]